VSLKLALLAFSLPALLSAAQTTDGQDPQLTVDLQQPGWVHARLSMPERVPAAVARAFAQAMECPLDALRPSYRPPSAIEVSCAVSLKPTGLHGVIRWDLTALNTALGRAGATGISIDVSRYRSAEFAPGGLLPWVDSIPVFQGHYRLGEFTYIALDVTSRPSDVRIMVAAGILILLLPLLLYPARRGGLLTSGAAAVGLYCLGATVWLCAVMRFNPPVAMPFPLSLAVVFLPMVAAVWVGSLVGGEARWRQFFWRGVRTSAVLTLYVGVFTISPARLTWAISCVVAVMISFWGLRWASRYRLEPVVEGELLARVHELSARAGTMVRSLRLLLGGDELPAAFASRYVGILISRGMLTTLSRREVDAIVAHELSHVRRPPLLLMRIVVVVCVVTVAAALMIPGLFPWTPLILPPLLLLHREFRRRNERIADADAVTWSGDGEALITGLSRITRAMGMPLEWPRWVKLLMLHPSTMQRCRAVAAQAGIPEERLAVLLEASTIPSGDHYPVPNSGAPFGAVFTPGERARLNRTLSMVCFVIPVLFGAAAPFIGHLAALLTGAFGVLLANEWVLAGFRSRVRAQLSGRPGVFAGFSPSAEPRIYNGSHDDDWGFAAFEGDSLVFRGDRGNWQVNRSHVEKIWMDGGLFSWLPHPSVCLRTWSGQVLSLRSFDGAFGLAKRRAAARLFDQAHHWHSAASAGEAAQSADPEPSFRQGQPLIPYTWRMFRRSLLQYGAISLFLYWMIALLSDSSGSMDPLRMFSALPVACALAWFVYYPGIRRSRVSRVLPPAFATAPPRR
jgi:heat shock protein HtpX